MRSLKNEVGFVAREPALEDQENPQAHRVVPAARCMLGYKALDRLGAKYAAARETLRSHRVCDVGFELVGEPAWKRHHEALLLAIDDVRRQVAPGERLQDP